MISPDPPDWYIPFKHDAELVKAAALYGINRTEFYYVNDQEFKKMDDADENKEANNLKIEKNSKKTRC